MYGRDTARSERLISFRCFADPISRHTVNLMALAWQRSITDSDCSVLVSEPKAAA